MELIVREETPTDAAAIRQVNVAAFGTDAEANLVDALRFAGTLCVSLVAEFDGEVVGHIAFSPVALSTGQRTISGVGLAPMAVMPRRQRMGVGGSLIAEGLGRLRRAGHPFCVVLGHAHYYPRHGFLRASTFGIGWEREPASELFFVQELVPNGLVGASGTVRYRPEFDVL